MVSRSPHTGLPFSLVVTLTLVLKTQSNASTLNPNPETQINPKSNPETLIPKPESLNPNFGKPPLGCSMHDVGLGSLIDRPPPIPKCCR